METRDGQRIELSYNSRFGLQVNEYENGLWTRTVTAFKTGIWIFGVNERGTFIPNKWRATV